LQFVRSADVATMETVVTREAPAVVPSGLNVKPPLLSRKAPAAF
jgi:hypothetical protein